MFEKIKQPQTWVVLGLLVVVAVVAYAIVTLNSNNRTTLAASVDEPGQVAEPAENLTDVGQASKVTELMEPVTRQDVTILTEDDRPSRLRAATTSWGTNWNKHTIDYNELLSGGPPRDGIPSIDKPEFRRKCFRKYLCYFRSSVK